MILTATMAALPSARPFVWLFNALSVLFGGDAEPLAEDAVLRLVEQARAGDRAARQRLYRQHVQRVFRTVRGMLRSDAEAEDVTQDAMLTALTSLDRYSPRSGTRFAAWLTTIAVNTTRRRFRRRGRRHGDRRAAGRRGPGRRSRRRSRLNAAASGAAARARRARRARARDRQPSVWLGAQCHGDRGAVQHGRSKRAQDPRACPRSPRRANRGAREVSRSSSMNDTELLNLVRVEPSARRHARIETRVFE
jgi:RNA polymerase sigma factor (sigma-70 family)